VVAFIKKPYLRVLHWALNNKKKLIAAVLVAFAGAIALFPFLGTSFIPEMNEGSLSPNFDRVPNISLDESLRMEMDAIKAIRSIPDVKKVVSRLGRGESPADPAGPNETDVIATLVPIEERKDGWTQDQIAEEMRRRLSVFPGVNLVMAQPISDRVDEMVTGVRAVRGFRDSKVDRVGGQQYMNINIDRQAIARFGLNAADINDVIETAVAGKASTEVYEGERRFQAAVRLPEALRNSEEDIKNILFTAPNGGRVRLEDLADVKIQEGPAQINRDLGKRRIVVGVNVQDRDLGGFVAELQQRIRQQVSLPPGYYITWGGQFQNMQRALRHLSIIVPITIGAIFFLLFLLFNSIRFAALIITVLPLASIGGLIGLFITGEYVSVPASVGFIALWGIAVLNGVVLVSYIRNLRENGMEQLDAIVTGAKLRFRPVMMTATVAALGLAPFLFAKGPGSEIQRPLAIVVMAGLITSTLLTLVVVPTLYALFEGGPDNGLKSKATTSASEPVRETMRA
jgi:heavy metal efflux system protein